MKALLLSLSIILPIGLFSQNGLHFDGVNDYVTSNYSGISGNAERTVEAWIQTTANAIGNQQVIVDWGEMSPNGSRFTVCVLQNNSLRAEVGGNGIVGTTPVNDGNWHHIAATYDPLATNKLKLYIDGNLETQGNFTVPVNTSGNGVVEIGRRNDQINQFTGAIDEVRIWDVARTQVEIQADMNNELCTTSPNLKLYYRMNEGLAGGANSGVNTVTDDSGNGFTGNLVSFALNGATSNWVTGASLATGMTSSTSTLDACDGYFWPVNGQFYTQSGVYSHQLMGSQGCDSNLVLDLSIFSPNDVSSNVVSCDAYFWSVSGETYTSGGSFDTILVTSQGCTYTHTLNLTINQGYDTVYNSPVCGPYTWPVNGQTYSINGLYSEVLTAANGCDSTISLNVFFYSPATASIVQNADGSLTGQGGTEYQWLDCDDSMQPIAGEMSSTFNPTINGNYAVVTSEFGMSCPDTSACFVVDYVGLESLNLNSISVAPNPTDNGLVKVNFSGQKVTSLHVLTADGREVLKKFNLVNSEEIQLPEDSGIYLVRVQLEDGTFHSIRVVHH